LSALRLAAARGPGRPTPAKRGWPAAPETEKSAHAAESALDVTPAQSKISSSRLSHRNTRLSPAAPISRVSTRPVSRSGPQYWL